MTAKFFLTSFSYSFEHSLSIPNLRPVLVKNIRKMMLVKVCIIRLVTFVFKNLPRLFDKYAVARTEHDALVKSTTKSFSNFVAFSENPNFT